MRAISLFLILLLTFAGAHSAHAQQLIAPADGIDSVRILVARYGGGIHITFSDDMVPLGGGHGVFPVRLEGPGACNWGWRGPRTISCLLSREDALPVGQAFTLVVDSGLKTQDGTELPGFRHEFETEMPRIDVRIERWKSPTDPELIAYANADIDTDDIERLLRLRASGNVVEPVRVRATRVDNEDWYQVSYRLEPRRQLPADTAFEIHVGAGLQVAGGGVAADEHSAGFFRTHGNFRFLGVGCDPTADYQQWPAGRQAVLPQNVVCAPEETIALVFSAPPAIPGLFTTLVDAGLDRSIARTLHADSVQLPLHRQPSIHSGKQAWIVRLAAVPGGAAQSIRLPDEITDVFGRPLPAATARFRTVDYRPAFIAQPGIAVYPSGADGALAFTTVNTDRINLRYRSSHAGEDSLLQEPTGAARPNESAITHVDVEPLLGRDWGVLAANASVNAATPRAFDDPAAMHSSGGNNITAIVSPWDIVAGHFGVPGPGPVFVAVRDFATGDAVAGATVELLGYAPRQRVADSVRILQAWSDGDVIGKGRTGADGLAAVAVNTDTDSLVEYVRISRDGITVVLPVIEHAFRLQSPMAGRSQWARRSFGEHLRKRLWSVTDKPLYRPGETVRLKGWLRVRDDNRWRIVDDTGELHLQCQNGGTNLCAGTPVTPDAFGAFDVRFTIPPSATDGEFRLSASDGKTFITGFSTFRVANFRPRPHRVELQIDDEHLSGDEKVALSATTEYFAGGPLANAPAEVRIVTRADFDAIPLPLLEHYNFGSIRWWQPEERQSVVQASFDAEGRLVGEFGLPDDAPESGTVVVTVGAQHASGEWAYSDAVEIGLNRQPYALGIDDTPGSVAPDQPFDSEIVLVTFDDASDKGLHVEQLLEYPGRQRWEVDATESEVADRCSVAVRADEPARCALTPTRLGTAIVRARLMRGDEELLTRDRQIIVTTNRKLLAGNTAEMRLQAGDNYSVGDTARVSFELPVDEADVLLTLHRGRVIRQWRQRLRASDPFIDIALDDEHAPGFTVAAVAVPAGEYGATLLGSLAVDVERNDVPPTIGISAGAEEFRAGDSVSLQISTTAKGPVQAAVLVVDEAVLDLLPDAEGLHDPATRFEEELKQWPELTWARLGAAAGRTAPEAVADQIEEIAVTAANSRMYSSAGNADLALSAPELAGAGNGTTPLRSRFAESALFLPSIDVAAGKTGNIEFRVPDNFGRWRAVVIGADNSGHLFADTTTFAVSQPLELRANLPARLLRGDRLDARTTIVNRAEVAADVSVGLTLEQDGTPVGSGEAMLTIAPGDSAALDAGSGALDGDVLTLTARARSADAADGLQLTTPIVGTIESRSWTAMSPFGAESELTQPIALPDNAVDDSARLQLRVDRSVIGDLSQAFRYTADNRHRNWEQMLSRALVASFADSWDDGRGYGLDQEAMAALLLAGLDFQAADGGMSHFSPPGETGNDYLSAYTLIATRRIAENGYGVPLWGFRVAEHLNQRMRMAIREREYGGQPKPLLRDMPVMLAGVINSQLPHLQRFDDVVEYLGKHADEFDTGGLAWALIALTKIDAAEDLRRDFRDRLLAKLVETFDRIEIDDGSGRFGSRSELYCTVLSALTNAGPLAPEARRLAKLVKGGIDFRQPESGFGNTHANALCIMALTDYRDTYEPETDALRVTATVDNDASLDIDLAATEATATSDEIALPLNERQSAVRATLAAGETAYFSSRVRYDVDLLAERERSYGYTIRREYAVFRGADWRAIDADDDVERGDWLRVQLRVVSPTTRSFVAITDPTPAGFEPVDAALVPGIPETGNGEWRHSRWAPFNRRQLSNIASRFYAEWLPPGEQVVTYYAQAMHAGTFAALPAKVESMYADGVFATTAPTSVTIRAVAGSQSMR